ncbi:uncharacterized protein LOC133879872 [Alnus glutinosa]|uniref:uncharacterized protein LOC133879872 n=1 Tax=Alnus glutinosa TaxID=3517 RepID=UPI002D7987FA|nr:uncharacterized protein LOC133879872 [Alnus glutinosa]
MQPWQPPSVGVVKVNWDAAIGSKVGWLRLGIIALNFQGHFMGAKCVMKRVVVDPKTAEAMAAFWAIQFCKEVGFFDVLFEGDAAQVVADINSKISHLSKYGHFVESIRSEIQFSRLANFVHVHREANMAAHVLAKHAPIGKEDSCWLEDIPLCISHIVCWEQLFP